MPPKIARQKLDLGALQAENDRKLPTFSSGAEAPDHNRADGAWGKGGDRMSNTHGPNRRDGHFDNEFREPTAAELNAQKADHDEDWRSGGGAVRRTAAADGGGGDFRRGPTGGTSGGGGFGGSGGGGFGGGGFGGNSTGGGFGSSTGGGFGSSTGGGFGDLRRGPGGGTGGGSSFHHAPRASGFGESSDQGGCWRRAPAATETPPVRSRPPPSSAAATATTTSTTAGGSSSHASHNRPVNSRAAALMEADEQPSARPSYTQEKRVNLEPICLKTRPAAEAKPAPAPAAPLRPAPPAAPRVDLAAKKRAELEEKAARRREEKLLEERERLLKEQQEWSCDSQTFAALRDAVDAAYAADAEGTPLTEFVQQSLDATLLEQSMFPIYVVLVRSLERAVDQFKNRESESAETLFNGLRTHFNVVAAPLRWLLSRSRVPAAKAKMLQVAAHALIRLQLPLLSPSLSLSEGVWEALRLTGVVSEQEFNEWSETAEDFPRRKEVCFQLVHWFNWLNASEQRPSLSEEEDEEEGEEEEEEEED